MESKRIKLKDLQSNVGQIPGLPTNPRQWTKAEISRIAKSLKETPELFEARPIIVTPYEGKYVILGGNLRFEGCKHNKDADAPCIVMPEDTDIDKLKEIVIKDNGSFGEWDFDALANEWDDLPLADWGVPAWDLEESKDDKPKTETERLSELTYDPLYYEPKEIPHLKLEQCLDLEKFNAKMDAIESFDLPDSMKNILKMFAYRFIKIDFEAVANYYYFNASDEEQKAIERLRLVLVDNGSINGFIEDDLLRVADIALDAAIEMEDEQ